MSRNLIKTPIPVLEMQRVPQEVIYLCQASSFRHKSLRMLHKYMIGLKPLGMVFILFINFSYFTQTVCAGLA